MENTKTPMKDKETKEWYKVEIRELIRKNLDKIHRKVGDSYGIDVSFLHKMISEYVDQELDKAREEVRREVYEAIVFDKNIPHDVTTFVAAHLWKNMRDKAKEELSKLNNK